MPFFRIKGRNQNTGKDFDEVVEEYALVDARATAHRKDIQVESITEVVPRSQAVKSKVLNYLSIADASPTDQKDAQPTAEQYHQYQLIKLGEISDSLKSIRGWVSFWSVILLIGLALWIFVNVIHS